MIVPGGGISLDRSRWISGAHNYLLPVPVLSRMFRGKMLALLKAAHAQSRLQFFGPHTDLADKAAFKTFLEPLYHTRWHVYAKRPFAGPQQVLAYLARYTHRVAISNSRLIKADKTGVTFRYKDYRIKAPGRCKIMTLVPGEFIRRFMLHVLPKGLHRIRHYGLLATCRTKAKTLARARELIAAIAPAAEMQCNDEAAASMEQPAHPCPCCGARMVIIETFAAGCVPRHRPTTRQLAIRIDTS
jgi:hypothetical protein